MLFFISHLFHSLNQMIRLSKPKPNLPSPQKPIILFLTLFLPLSNTQIPQSSDISPQLPTTSTSPVHHTEATLMNVEDDRLNTLPIENAEVNIPSQNFRDEAEIFVAPLAHNSDSMQT